jgi:hypothetical protein
MARNEDGSRGGREGTAGMKKANKYPFDSVYCLRRNTENS